MAREGRTRNPRLYMVPLRALLFSLLVTLVAFALGLLVGLVGIVIYSRAHGIAPDMRLAYRDIAAPFAAVVGTMVLIMTLAMEVRHYRQSKALASIERAK